MIILGTNSIKDTGYNVANSVRFNKPDVPYLHKALSSGNRKTWTYSVWVKRGNLGVNQYFLPTQADPANNNAMGGSFNANDKIDLFDYNAPSVSAQIITNRVFRDVGSWYHIAIVVDTTQSSANDRLKLFVNGVNERTVGGYSTDTMPSLNYDFNINESSHSIYIGTYFTSSPATSQFDGYMSEVVFLDGTAAAIGDLGEFDSDSPTIWKPKDVSGLTPGTNGFYLDFEDSSNLGNDVFGGTDLTEVNLAATDQSTDTCTNNFATLNSLIDKGITYSEGNLQYKNTHGSNSEFTLATIQEVSNGRWYWEIKMASTNNNSAYEYFGNGTAYVKSNGDIHPSGTTTVSNGDIFGFYLNYEDGQMTIHRNGSEVYQSSSGISLSTTTAQIAAFNNTEYQLNFGNPIHSISSGNADANGYGNFEYSPVLSSVNFYSLCTKNLAEFG